LEKCNEKRGEKRKAVADTGSSSHCFKRSNIDKNIKINESDIIVKSAKAGINLTPIGRADIGSTYKNTLIFNDNELEKELVSIPRLDDEGCEIIIKGGELIIKRDNNIIMQGKKENGLYMLDLRKTENILLADNAPRDRKELLQRLHSKLGHRSLFLIRKYVKQGLIKLQDFPKEVSDAEIKSLPLCESCQKAKFTTMRRRGRGNRTADNAGQKLVTDMKGPIRVSGLKGQHYYQGFMDVYSKYLYHKCFKRKSEAFNNLEEVLMLPLYKDKLEVYHSDGAQELLSRKIIASLKTRGIQNTFSAPYKHSDNSIIERSHRTIFEMAHTLLLFASLSISFWVEAVDHAVYLYNRMPTATGAGYIAPITVAFGTIVDLSHEATFGCTCYALIAQETREKGFVDKANKCLYLGHRPDDSPGYVVYHNATNKTMYTSDITFDESDLFDGSRKESNDITNELMVSDVSRHPDDFKWLEGMAYRDQEQMFITTRVCAQQGWVVAFRASLINDTIGAEETRPLHAADVEHLVKLYTSSNNIIISLNNEEKQLYEVSNTAGNEMVGQGSVNAGPHTDRLYGGGDAKADESGAGCTEGEPQEATSISRIEVNSQHETAAGVHRAQTESTTEGGEPPVVLGETSVSINKNVRSRRPRTLLNAGVLGDIERVYYFAEEGNDFEVNLSDPNLTKGKNTLLYDDILTTDNPFDWLEAGRKEANSIIMENDVFESCDLPQGVKPLDTKWVFKRKQDPDHSWRYKGRLCVKGFTQKKGVNYFDTFAPTAKWISLRIFLTMCACLSLHTRQLDVKTAFLYAPLDEEIFIKLPKGLDDSSNPFGLSRAALRKCRGPYLRLRKSLYGLKQAPRNWFLLLKKFLLGLGFTNLLTETCLFVKYTNNNIILILVFVDDILLGCKDDSLLDELVNQFAQKFKIKDSGEVNLYLSINIEIDYENMAAYLDQTDYILAMWSRFGYKENKNVKSPFQENWKIHGDEERANMTDSDWSFARSFPYRELVGSLLFISMCTRGDICYQVHYLSRFLENPPKAACLAAKRTLQYLYNTRDRKLVLGGSNKPLLTLFCDTDWATCVETRKSVECYLLFFGMGCIMWMSKQQNNIANSTAEAEYCCLTPGTNIVRWTRNVLHELEVGYRRATAIYTDNTTAQNFTENPVHHSRMKQLHLKFLELRELSNCGVIACGRVDTKENPADLGTKALGVKETEKKSEIFFEGLSKADYIPIQRPSTIPNDYSV
jgi:hypothetical protein